MTDKENIELEDSPEEEIQEASMDKDPEAASIKSVKDAEKKLAVLIKSMISSTP